MKVPSWLLPPWPNGGRLAPLVMALTLGLTSPVHAVNPSEKLPDPVLEARARALSKELRCLVCQNQSIDDSDAGLARDLRVLVRERLVAGDSDEQIMQFVTSRYGDFVRLRPPVTGYTALLWGGPFALLLLAGTGTALYLRQRRRDNDDQPIPTLSPEEEARVAALLMDTDGKAEGRQ